MSNSVKDNLFPVLSVMAGVAVTVAGARWMERLEEPEPEVQAAIDKFDQLEPGQQGRLLTQAAGFDSKDPEYKERIVSIHETVTADPSLEPKLRMLHEWWRPLNATQKAKIRSYHGNSAEWVGKVRRAYLESQAADHVVVMWIGPPLPEGKRRTVDLTEPQFESFLESLIPAEVPSELADKLNGFESDDDRCEITLTKIIWVLHQIRSSYGPSSYRSPQPGRPPQATRPPKPKGPSSRVFDSIRIADFQKLFDVDEWELLSTVFFNPRGDDEPHENEDTRRREAVLLVKCIGDGLMHYKRVLGEKHRSVRNGDSGALNENDDNLVEVFEHGDRGMQLDLMKMDPSRAADSLKLEMERERLNAEDAEDSAVAGLINDLAEFRHWPFGSRGGMGRGPSSGGRSGFGRPDRDDGRGGRDDGRSGSRSGDGRRSGGGGPPRGGSLEIR